LGALTIAFDTIIVGALALPWVYLIVHLFFFKSEGWLQDFLDWVQDNNLQAIAAVLLFAVTYTLGSSIERVAQDFFNDDDLRIPYVFFMTWTENRIIASVYCETDNRLLQPESAKSAALADELQKLEGQSICCKPQATCANSPLDQTQPCPCEFILKGFAGHASGAEHGKKEDELKGTTWDIFGIEENGLLLKGDDDTLRLRQMHDQIVVLRGATFNGLIAFSLCLFSWCVKIRLTKPLWKWRWVPACVPGVFLLLAVLALYHHLFVEHNFAHPPYMEFSLLAICGVGGFLLWSERLKSLWSRLKSLWSKPEKPQAKEAPPGKASTETVHSPEPQPTGSKPSSAGNPIKNDACLRDWRWGMLSFVFGFLFVAGFLGWWATESLYVQEVIYSYNSQPLADASSNK
jgi:hypothetical protein